MNDWMNETPTQYANANDQESQNEVNIKTNFVPSHILHCMEMIF